MQIEDQHILNYQIYLILVYLKDTLPPILYCLLIGSVFIKLEVSTLQSDSIKVNYKSIFLRFYLNLITTSEFK